MQTRLLSLLRSDGGEGVWSIELTFLSLAKEFGRTGVGMKIRSHVNCEYYYYIYSTFVLKTNEQMIYDFIKNLCSL